LMMLSVLLWLSFIYGMYNGAMIPALTEIMPAEVRFITGIFDQRRGDHRREAAKHRGRQAIGQREACHAHAGDLHGADRIYR
jgi:hypothetical protein